MAIDPYSLFKGTVGWYCFDVKPFNLTVCFFMKFDTNSYDYTHQNGGPWTAMYSNVQALVTFFLTCTSYQLTAEYSNTANAMHK